MLNMKYNAVICAIAKCENPYINEWVNWYYNLGFDHIYLFDNNDSSERYVGDFIEKKDFVTIIPKNDIRQGGIQFKCYNEFYNKEKNNFDWCLFCDIDEFLTGVENIHDLLKNSKFDGFFQICVPWTLFSDGNIIERDLSSSVVESFKEKSKNTWENDIVKSIVRGGLENVFMRNHFCGELQGDHKRIRSCLPSGTECTGEYHINEDSSNETVRLNHYKTKSLSEFLRIKVPRGDTLEFRTIDMKYYWNVNDKTEEKLRYIENYCNKWD